MKRTIPPPAANQADINRAIKENLEQIMGQRGGRIAPLPATASADDVLAKVNEILERLQG